MNKAVFLNHNYINLNNKNIILGLVYIITKNLVIKI